MKNKIFIFALVIVLAAAAVFYWSAGRGGEDDLESEEDSVMCTQDVMQCPDGSYVGRVAPDCSFAKCPDGNNPPPGPVFEDGTLPPDATFEDGTSAGGSAGAAVGPEGVFCTMDAKMCPDGSYVGRVAPKCEFAPCPGE